MSTALRVSLGLNVALAATLAVLLWRGAARPAAPVPAAVPPAPRSVAPPASAAGPAAPADDSPAGINPTAVAQLERMGLEREVIVNALLGDFHRRWDARFAALERQYAPRRVPEREYTLLGRQRDADQVRFLQEALGPAGYEAWDRDRTLRLINAGGLRLSAAEADRAYRLQKAFDDEYKALQTAVEDGVADAADAGALHAQAQAALDRELEALLGPDRYRVLRGATDPIADVYRNFGDLNPSPGQAREILQAEEGARAREAALAARLRGQPADAAAVAAELAAIRGEREAELRRILGAGPYEAARREADPTYQKLSQFAAAWELQPAELEPVYAPLRALHDEAGRLREAAALREAAGERVDWNEINDAIEQLRRQTETRLQAVIGGKRLWRLKENGLLASP